MSHSNMPQQASHPWETSIVLDFTIDDYSHLDRLLFHIGSKCAEEHEANLDKIRTGLPEMLKQMEKTPVVSEEAMESLRKKLDADPLIQRNRVDIHGNVTLQLKQIIPGRLQPKMEPIAEFPYHEAAKMVSCSANMQKGMIEFDRRFRGET